MAALRNMISACLLVSVGQLDTVSWGGNLDQKLGHIPEATVGVIQQLTREMHHPDSVNRSGIRYRVGT